MSLISFDQALGRAKKCKSVLLGNGFSIACSDVFNYRTLLANASLEERLELVFNELDTADFEIVINELESAARLLRILQGHENAVAVEFEELSQSLRMQFANSITNSHVQYDQVFQTRRIGSGLKATEQERTCFGFLQNFHQVFTTNYDLLLYWSIMKSFEPQYKSVSIPTNDGFTRAEDSPVFYQGGDAQRVFYLHGSLFFQQDGLELIKRERDHEHGVNILPIVAGDIEENNMPLIVLEGESRNKLTKISEHYYLERAIKSLEKLDGALFIHGHSLDVTDQHIFDVISNSRVEQVFISTLSESLENEMFQRAVLRMGNKKNREFILYDALSANVWDFNIL